MKILARKQRGKNKNQQEKKTKNQQWANTSPDRDSEGLVLNTSKIYSADVQGLDVCGIREEGEQPFRIPMFIPRGEIQHAPEKEGDAFQVQPRGALLTKAEY